jgi:hypothetical protein
MVVLAALAAGFCACGAASASTKPTRITFGIEGGNIAPYHFTIEPTGVVRASGWTRPRRHALSPAQVVSLSRLVRNDFSAGMKNRQCRGTLPDFASHFIRADGRSVTVRGGCEPHFQRLWNTLARAVGIATRGG